MSRITVFRWVAGAVLALLLLVPATPGLAVPPQNHWGYAIGRQPTTASYQPGANGSRDDLNTPITIDHTGTGTYAVTYPNEQVNNPNFGIFLVTAISTTGGTCGDARTDIFPSFVKTTIACFNRAGVPVNSKFSTNYLVRQTQVGKAAYLFADQPSAPSYTAESSNQFNSTGASNTISRSGVGWYDVLLPGLGTSGGHVEVTAAFDGGYCQVVGMAAFGGDESVRVYCRDATGARADGQFDLAFTNHGGLKKAASAGVAYLVADRPAAANYAPAARYHYQTNGGAARVFHGSVGQYSVVLGGLMAGGAAQVTTYGNSNARCELSSVPASGHQATIGVRCVKPDGTPTDAKFGLEYTR